MSCIQPTKFAHVVYRTRRFERMLQWYESVFGAGSVPESGSGFLNL